MLPTRRSRARSYDAELCRCRPEATLVEFGDYHPLKPIMVGVHLHISLLSRNCTKGAEFSSLHHDLILPKNITHLSAQVTDTKTRRGARKGSTSSSSSSSSSAPTDPLSSMLDGTDPLSMFAAASAVETPTMSHSASAGVCVHH